MCVIASLPLCTHVNAELRKLWYQLLYNFKLASCRANHCDAHEVNLCLVLSLEGLWSYEVHTECLPRFGDGKLCWKFAIKTLPTLVHLVTMTCFDVWLDCLLATFPIDWNSKSFFKTLCPGVLYVVAVPHFCTVLELFGITFYCLCRVLSYFWPAKWSNLPCQLVFWGLGPVLVSPLSLW